MKSGKNSRYTAMPLTEELAKKGSPALVFNLNGGGKTLAKMIDRAVAKSGKTQREFREAAGISGQPFYKYKAAKSPGISLSALRGFAKAFDMSVVALGRKLHLSTKGGKRQKPAAKLGDVMEALGVGQTDLACSVVIGEDRLTVERMAGQESQPVVVEHSGHRLIIEKA